MILLIDSYDSFSYNLYQLVGMIHPEIRVIRNDEMTVREILSLKPDHIILSPGPGRPEDAGVLMETVRKAGPQIPVLGVCLGHQAICAAFGAKITYAQRLMHGKQSMVEFDLSCPLFKGCPSNAPAARYHSLAADPGSIPESLLVTARADDGEIMGIRHKDYPVYGVQFHPESILTPCGTQILTNFIREI